MNVIRFHQFLDGSACNPPLPAKACVHSAIERTLNRYYSGLPEWEFKKREAAKQHLLRHFKDYKWLRWIHLKATVASATGVFGQPGSIATSSGTTKAEAGGARIAVATAAPLA